MPHVDIRFEIQNYTVDPDTTGHFIREFVTDKFSFIDSAVQLEDDGFGTLTPNEDKRTVNVTQSGEAG
jgi:hypothetical protein